MKTRYLAKAIQKDALKSRKMAFVSGPRQVGKTTMARALLKDKNNYFSWDESQFRKLWATHPEQILSSIGRGPIALDELHKDRLWKRRLKGLYDMHGHETPILVTGSAKLNIYRRGGDSLLGRYLPYRLHPFSVAERTTPLSPDKILSQFRTTYPWDDLLRLGGYPEPLLVGSEKKALRWSRLRLDRLAYEDTRDVKNISNLNAFRTLLDLVPHKVSSLFSIQSLQEDVGVAYATLRDWMLLSEMLYYGFFIKPYHKKITRTLKAMPKFYLYDVLQITQSSHRLENLTALHLLKACHFWTDTAEGLFELFFIRDKQQREVDFLVTQNKKPWLLVECKTGDKNISPHLIHFSKILAPDFSVQLVRLKKHHHYDRLHKVHIIDYEKFFSSLV